jgi:predicted dehydrogenase
MADDRIRVGIIGLGAWGSRAHLPAFAAHPEVDVLALADPDEQAARRAAEAHGVGRVVTDAGALFRDPGELDAVVIATPDDTHRDLVMAAFDTGLHVLCEKPLAYTVAQAEEMAAAAERSRRIAKIGFLFRHSPVVTRMRELVEQGLIGEVQLFEHIGVNAQFIDPNRPMHWKMRRAHAPGGVYVEYGAHTIDLALWFGGRLASVVAHAATLIPERPLPGGGSGPVELDDVASWIGEYASGGQALFRSGWASLPAGSNAMCVYGTHGTLLWRQHGRTSEALVAATLDDQQERTLFEFEPPYEPGVNDGPFPMGILFHYNRRLVESFVRDIRDGETSWPSFADGLAAQHVLSAIRTSLDERRWAAVDGS